jgi:hypothetical protein
MMKLIFVAVGMAAVVAIVSIAPDVRRYLRIRAM